jgi:hypothetical protein
MDDAKPDAQAPDAQAAERDYYISVVEAWGKRPFFVNSAKETAERLKGLGFRAYLDHGGALLIADATGMGRDLSRFVSADDLSDMFSALSAGLAQYPQLLDPYQPEPRRPRPVKVRAAATPQPEPVKSVCAYRCAHCGSDEEQSNNLIIKVGVIGVGERAFVDAKCWADWRAAQDGEPAPDINNSEGFNDDEEAS